ncbi:MAG: cation:dicarboxylase symporter family transporter [Bacteriovoracaceae bacterium]
MLVVVGALLIQQFVVYSALLKFIGKINPFKFYKDCSDVYLYAFATASSNATLPRSLETAEQTFKIAARSFTFCFNGGIYGDQNGTAILKALQLLAQVYGIELSLANRCGCVNVDSSWSRNGRSSGGSLPLIMILLKQMGIPLKVWELFLG